MTLLHSIEATAARAAVHILRALSPVAASNVGGAIARTIGPLLPASRIADINLQMALPELDSTARRRVIRGVWDNLGRTLGELPHLGRLVKDAPTGPAWRMEGVENFEAIAASGGPAIFVTGHFGNWEMLPPAAAHFGSPLSSFFRPADNRAIDVIIAELRARAGGGDVSYFAKGREGAVQALIHLRRGGFLGVLFDQKMNDGIEARLFGRPSMTAPAAARLALRLGCPVIPIYVCRDGPARLCVVCEPALTHPQTGDKAADILALTQAMNDRLEAWVRARPEAWLWLHRRWNKSLYTAPLPPFPGGKPPG